MTYQIALPACRVDSVIDREGLVSGTRTPVDDRDVMVEVARLFGRASLRGGWVVGSRRLSTSFVAWF